MSSVRVDFSVPTPSVVKNSGVRLEFVDGLPTMVAGDTPFWGFMHTIDPYEKRPYVEAVQSMYQQGVRLFSFLLPLPVAWLPDGGYDFTLFDALHKKLLSVAPEALFYPRVFMTTPDWWDETHPDELLGFRGEYPRINGSCSEPDNPLWKYEFKMYHSPSNPSIASKKWREAASDALAAYVKHTWEGDYAGHWFAYQIAYGCCGEWTPFGIYVQDRYGNYDFSKPMVESFRARLAGKYASDSELRRAWNDRDVTLETAEPPTKLQMLKTDVGVLKNPHDAGHYADWVEHYSRVFHDALIHFGRAAKDAAPVDVLTGSFAGYRLQVGCSAYVGQLAHVDLDYLLESDAIDILSTPNVYHDRKKGVFSQAVVATIARKKIFLAENDVRTYKSGDSDYGPGLDSKFSVMSFKRDTFYNFTQGGGHEWWYDFGLGWYLEPVYEDIICRLVKASKDITPADRQGQADVALVIDELSYCYTEGCSNYLQLSRQCVNEYLPRMGTSFDVITYDDMLQRDPYKLYIFRDLFYAPDARAAQVRSLLTNNNASALWLFASGMLGEESVDPEQAQKLTGIRLGLINTTTSHQVTLLNLSHPVTEGVGQIIGTKGNDDIRGVYGPIVYADDSEAQTLGQIESLQIPGMAFKRDGERFDCWIASPLLPPKLLGNLAREAGAHMYVESGVVIFGCGNLFSLQSDQECTIEFTPKMPVESVYNLLTAEAYPRSRKSFTIPIGKDDPVLVRCIPAR